MMIVSCGNATDVGRNAKIVLDTMRADSVIAADNGEK